MDTLLLQRIFLFHIPNILLVPCFIILFIVYFESVQTLLASILGLPDFFYIMLCSHTGNPQNVSDILYLDHQIALHRVVRRAGKSRCKRCNSSGFAVNSLYCILCTDYPSNLRHDGSCKHQGGSMCHFFFFFTVVFFFVVLLRVDFFTVRFADFLFIVLGFLVVFVFRAGDFFFAVPAPFALARVPISDGVAVRVNSGIVLNRDVSARLPFSLGNMMLWYMLYMVKANRVSGSELS